MSSFNILTSVIHCENCGSTYEARIQFKYGDTWQLEYKIGDRIKWGGNDIGKEGVTMVKVYGVLESDRCPMCKEEVNSSEFDIIIEKDIITRVDRMLKYEYEDEGNYKILKI